MATTSSLPKDLARLGIQLVEYRADDAILENNHAVSSTIHRATGETSFPFLRLPVELQIGVLSHVTRYSSLRALCLVSKEVADIATPRLFYKVDLRQKDWSEEPPIRQRIGYLRTLRQINSLLTKPANLLFVRVLNTSYLTPELTEHLGRLLPLFRTDFLTRISFAPKSILCFPTPQQTQLLLSRQRKIQNLRLFSHMAPSVDEFVRKNEPSRKAVLASFTRLNISDEYDGCATNTPATMFWPLVTLDLSVLRDLKISGLGVPPLILTRLNALFARGILVNLSRLMFEWVVFDDTLTLVNLPSLKLLNLSYCQYGKPNRPLVLNDGFKLRYFWYYTCGNTKELVPLLAQIKGLEYLSISGFEPVWEVDKAQRDVARAISLYKETLLTLDLGENLNLDFLIGRTMWHFHVVEAIKKCRKLVMLSLPLVSDKPPLYYRHLARCFPDLIGLTVYDGINNCSTWDSEAALQLFPASSKLTFVHFKGPGTMLNNDRAFEKCFVRTRLEHLCYADVIELD